MPGSWLEEQGVTVDVAVGTVPGGLRVLGVPVLAHEARGTGPPGLEVLSGVTVPEGLEVTGAVAGSGFGARAGQALALRSSTSGTTLVLLGLGPPEGLDAERWRRAAAALVRAAGEANEVGLLLPPDPGARATAAAVEGATLAAYRFEGYRSRDGGPRLERLVLLVGNPAAADDLRRGAARGATVAGAVAFARDLVNTPPSDMMPAKLAQVAAERIGTLRHTSVEIWDERRIEAEHLGGLLGVSRGSEQPPRLVRVHYDPPPDAALRPHVALVGKGITFDSGGLSLKTADGMTTMKTDMSGAAIVLAATAAGAELGLGVEVTALAPVSENMPGGAAIKPGDVLTIRNGSTIEVLNTDAEGRLVLADALSLATELSPSPDAVIDVATLTGAATVALGKGIGALFGNDQELIERVRAAGARAGEPLWPLPLPEDYADHIESDVADMKNIGRPGQAGAIVAALLLSRFVGDLRWAHLDIAGPGRSTESSGYLTKGGTGFGVRTLVELLACYAGE